MRFPDDRRCSAPTELVHAAAARPNADSHVRDGYAVPTLSSTSGPVQLSLMLHFGKEELFRFSEDGPKLEFGKRLRHLVPKIRNRMHHGRSHNRETTGRSSPNCETDSNFR